MIKLTIVVLLLVILFNLFRALLHLVNAKPGQPISERQKVAQLLGRRVLLSAGVLLLLILAMALGLLEPNARPY